MLNRQIPGVLLAMLLVFTGCDADDAPEIGEGEETEELPALTFAFQPQENPEGLQLKTDAFGDYIAEELDRDVEIFLPTNYSAVVEALRGENADVAYFSGLPYMMAHQMADAEILVVEERDGEPFYFSQWYTLKDSGIEKLEDLEDHTVAFTSPTSTSGYLFPMAEITDRGLIEEKGEPGDFFADVMFAGGYQQALLALINEQVTAAAASDYALQQYLDDEQRDRIRVLSEQGPVPTHGLAVRGGLDDDVKQAIKEALLKLNEPEHRELLESIYGAERLVERDHDDHVEALRDAYELVDFTEDI